MKDLSVLFAFLGGAVVGAAAGILFAPDKGVDTRRKIAHILKEKGICLHKHEMDDLVEKIALEINSDQPQ